MAQGAPNLAEHLEYVVHSQVGQLCKVLVCVPGYTHERLRAQQLRLVTIR
jgi:hypothetical protein